MKLIECENVSFSYENTEVVKNLNFQLNDGDYLCIVGENGSGKSTLIKGLLGLKQTSGGRIIRCEGLKAKGTGYLPQQTPAQKDFPASVFEVVLSGNENIKRLGIEELKNQSYRDLSGGQQQRVLLARALCASKQLLLLDEPVTGLDPIITDEMYRLIDDLNKNEKITIIMVSHDIGSSVKYASHILHLNYENSFYGTKEEYLKSPVGKRFLGSQET